MRRYVHGFDVDEPVVSYDGSSTADSNRHYLVADVRGSIVAVTDSAGNVGASGTGVNTYDAYGLPNTGNTGRFQYTGQVWLPEIGMYYYKARLYNPVIGRFMQTDPIGYGDGMNWYAYVHNDPINGKDSTGKCYEMTGSPCIDAFQTYSNTGCDDETFGCGATYNVTVYYTDGTYGSFATSDGRYGYLLNGADSWAWSNPSISSQFEMDETGRTGSDPNNGIPLPAWIRDPFVRAAMGLSWTKSNPASNGNEKEQGAYVVQWNRGGYGIFNQHAGDRDSITFGMPPIQCLWFKQCDVVGAYHTHPNPANECDSEGCYDPTYQYDEADRNFASRFSFPSVVMYGPNSFFVVKPW